MLRRQAALLCNIEAYCCLSRSLDLTLDRGQPAECRPAIACQTYCAQSEFGIRDVLQDSPLAAELSAFGLATGPDACKLWGVGAEGKPYT